jgi:glutathione S-transferase
MKLYYSPAACSLAPHIALREAGLSFHLEKVDLKTGRTAGDADYARINPKGYVPALQFDDGSTLTEVAAILQWIADEAPHTHLAPAAGTMARYRLIEWLNFIATEIHRNMGALFQADLPEATRNHLTATLARRLDYTQQQLGSRPFLTGEQFTVADAYLYVVLNWARWVKFDLARWPRLAEFNARVAARPAVQAALKVEGLVK